jgi:hypothetical protein
MAIIITNDDGVNPGEAYIDGGAADIAVSSLNLPGAITLRKADHICIDDKVAFEPKVQEFVKSLSHQGYRHLGQSGDYNEYERKL